MKNLILTLLFVLSFNLIHAKSVPDTSFTVLRYQNTTDFPKLLRNCTELINYDEMSEHCLDSLKFEMFLGDSIKKVDYLDKHTIFKILSKCQEYSNADSVWLYTQKGDNNIDINYMLRLFCKNNENVYFIFKFINRKIYYIAIVKK
jgi:hypothetical protein